MSPEDRTVTAKCRSKVMQKAPTGAFCITFELNLGGICLQKLITFNNEWSFNTGLPVDGFLVAHINCFFLS